MSGPDKSDSPAGDDIEASVSLETALERLDAIVREMEAGELPLEALIAKYEEGFGLSRLCREKLEHAEERIRIISRDAAGNPVLEEFDAKDEE